MAVSYFKAQSYREEIQQELQGIHMLTLIRIRYTLNE
jgi:hypothetical protein